MGRCGVNRVILCSVVLLCMLCACTAREVPPDADRVSPRPKDIPPGLIVRSIDGDESVDIIATMGTYSWDYGTGGVEADALHPLDMEDIATIADVPQKIELVFTGQVIGYTVDRWVKGAGYEDYDTVKPEGNTITPPDDGKSHVYEVTVEYTNGIVHYAFKVNK